ncbi:MAG TPA: DMT family transporter [Azospirillaceae bacterium]|nr:DMT family transporter [Azospirillaceae bacterium]
MTAPAPAHDTSPAALPSFVQGVLWALAATVVFALMTVTIRESTRHMHPMVAVFWRNGVALLCMLPWIVRHGTAGLRTTKLRLYTTRALTGAVAMFTWFYGLTGMPLGTAQALGFTQPLFATLLAAMVLREDVRARRWSATLLGFAGVLIIIQPGARPVGLPEIAVLVSAFAGAMSAIQVKALAKTESTSAMVAFLAIYMTPISLVPALFVWTWPSVEAWGWVLAMGVLGTIGHLCIVRAYHMAEASALMPFDYVKLPLVALCGWALYGELLDHWFWIGSAIIAGSAIYIARRETAIARRGRPVAGAAGATTKAKPHL